MKHLTVDEIIDHVSFERLDQQTLENAAKVNSHIRCCSRCLRKVRAFQIVYDELVRVGNKSAFRRAAMELDKAELTFGEDRELYDGGI